MRILSGKDNEINRYNIYVTFINPYKSFKYHTMTLQVDRSGWCTCHFCNGESLQRKNEVGEM